MDSFNTESNLPAPETGAPDATTPSSKPADTAIDAEIDEAMAALGFGQKGQTVTTPRPRQERHKPTATERAHSHDIVNKGGKAPIRGPRVVQAGREYRPGKVVSVGPTDIFIEFGPKELGLASRTQWTDEDVPKVGETVEVVVDRFEASEGLFICSRPGAVQKAAWEEMAIGQVVEARVTAVNKGGLELEVGGHKAFMPASQVSIERVPDLSVFIGEKFTCQVSQLDKRGRGNIVLSRRDLLQQERAKKAEELKGSIKEGDVLDGTVRKIMPFGAFVDLGGVDGLVHLADLTYDRVGYGEQAVGKHVKEGQAVRVKVLKVDWENNRLSLGIKQMLSDPFATATTEIKEGEDRTGRITRLADFGAFVELAPGVEGLVHVSEIAHRRINHPQDVLKTDQVVQARVLKIDAENRRISLSIKSLIAAPEPKGGGRGKKEDSRSVEEIRKETPQLRRLREKSGAKKLTGGFGAAFDDGGGLKGLKLG